MIPTAYGRSSRRFSVHETSRCQEHVLSLRKLERVAQDDASTAGGPADRCPHVSALCAPYCLNKHSSTLKQTTTNKNSAMGRGGLLQHAGKECCDKSSQNARLLNNSTSRAEHGNVIHVATTHRGIPITAHYVTRRNTARFV